MTRLSPPGSGERTGGCLGLRFGVCLFVCLCLRACLGVFVCVCVGMFVLSFFFCMDIFDMYLCVSV